MVSSMVGLTSVVIVRCRFEFILLNVDLVSSLSRFIVMVLMRSIEMMMNRLLGSLVVLMVVMVGTSVASSRLEPRMMVGVS